MDGNTDYLPEIEEAPDSNVNMVINEEVESDGPVEPVGKTNDDDDEEIIEEEEPVPEVKPKKILEQREIFKPPKLQQVISTTTGKPKKKMSQKQLDHLAKIRKKAMITRMKNKKLREEGKAVETSKKVQKENVRIQEKIIKEKEKLSNQEIEQITFNAIEKYETLRKTRKAKKRETLEKEKKEKGHMEQVNKHLNSAISVQQPQTDVWDDVLSGMWK